MQNNSAKILPIEKIISILSYLSMGIIGVIWYAIAYFRKQRIKYFLIYNIAQSMIISIFLALFNVLVFYIILPIMGAIPIIDCVAALINIILSFKILRIYLLNLSFSIPELVVTILIIYIIIGIIKGRIVYIPYLTNIINKALKNYN